jgi:hypothetical protein
LYKWMVTNNINNISNNKIVLLKSFIANNNNKNKILRLSNQQFIIKKENCIKLVLKQ